MSKKITGFYPESGATDSSAVAVHYEQTIMCASKSILQCVDMEDGAKPFSFLFSTGTRLPARSSEVAGGFRDLRMCSQPLTVLSKQ